MYLGQCTSNRIFESLYWQASQLFVVQQPHLTQLQSGQIFGNENMDLGFIVIHEGYKIYTESMAFYETSTSHLTSLNNPLIAGQGMVS